MSPGLAEVPGPVQSFQSRGDWCDRLTTRLSQVIVTGGARRLTSAGWGASETSCPSD